jgi:tRNA 2-selenouridine synthase
LISIQEFIKNCKNYDLIIDARSPREFAESHIPGAQNFYALNDDEYAEVGTIYRQLSPFEARVKGAAYVCKNAITHISSLYPAYTPKAKIAIYCAKGGMRSASLSTIFSNIGYRIDRIEGGYRSYRSFVTDYLDNMPKFNFVTLRGYTGCGKSELIEKLENAIDLEAMANHYGSVFGLMNGEQPTQKEFQNCLADTLLRLDAGRPVFIEGESKRIGRLTLPNRLYEMMAEGIQVRVETSVKQRVRRIVEMYRGIDKAYFTDRMEKITPYIKKSAKDEAIEAFDADNLERVAEILLVEYYDKVYKKSEKVDFVISNDDENIALKALRDIGL